MAYEIYKQLLSEEAYFNNWDVEKVECLTEDLKEQIYKKYIVKAKIFQRDNFKCTNADCEFPDSELTMHHVKWQKNGGENKEINCVALCKACHKGYHRGKRAIRFDENSTVPVRLRGHTFDVGKEEEINWKVVKKDMKQLRKNMKHLKGIVLTEKQLIFLMRWLDEVVDLDDLE